jgi:hypothetical protein
LGIFEVDRKLFTSGILEGKMSRKERETIREDLAPYAEVLAQRFVQRRDVYARQLDDGSYVAVYKRLRPGHLMAHLRGDITLGTYLLDEESRGQFMVLDADDDPDWRRLGALATMLAEEGASTYLEPSRRGGHLWAFFDEPTAGEEIRRFGQGLLDYFGIETMELFPKQGRLTSGPGSLIRLPFGIHRKSGQRYGFYLPGGEPLALTLREQIMALRAPETLPEPLVERFVGIVSEMGQKGPPERFEGPQGPRLERDEDAPVSERIKAAIPVRQFVLRYVELSPSGKGLCPFHDDHHESFNVNDEQNYWYCFACEEGGSIIDFWMKKEDVDFTTAVTELADRLLPGPYQGG